MNKSERLQPSARRKEILACKGITQSEIAARLGVSLASVSREINGIYNSRPLRMRITAILHGNFDEYDHNDFWGAGDYIESEPMTARRKKTMAAAELRLKDAAARIGRTAAAVSREMNGDFNSKHVRREISALLGKPHAWLWGEHPRFTPDREARLSAAGSAPAERGIDRGGYGLADAAARAAWRQELCRTRGVSLAEIGRRLGVSGQSVGAVIREMKRSPYIRAGVSRLLRIPFKRLWGDEEPDI